MILDTETLGSGQVKGLPEDSTEYGLAFRVSRRATSPQSPHGLH